MWDKMTRKWVNMLKCPLLLRLNIQEDQIRCLTRGSNRTGEHGITVRFGGAERHLQGLVYHYTPNPNITMAAPSKSFLRWLSVSAESNLLYNLHNVHIAHCIIMVTLFCLQLVAWIQLKVKV